MSRCRCASGQGADSSRLSLGLDANGPGVVRGRFRWGRSASALGGRGAVRVQDRAGDVGGILAGEEQEGRRDLARLAGALHRRLGAEARDVLGVEGRGDERRPDRPRRDAVHPDALLDELLRERAGEGDDRALRGAVVEKLRAAAIGRHRCGVDDRGALLQMRQRRLGHEEIAEDVGSEGALDLLRRDLVDVLLRMLLGGVVDEDVEAAEAIDDLLDRLLAEAGVADVAGDGEAVAPLGLDEPLGLARVLALVQVHDGDVSALAGEQDRHGAGDAGVAAGDDRYLVVEPSAAREARRVVRPRVHLGLAPGLLVLLLRRKGFLLGHGKSSAKARAVNAGFFRGVPGPPLPPRRATAFTHFGLSGLAMSDSLSWRDGGSGDGAFAGAVWRPPPGKRGAFLHARLVETGGRGVRVRRLGASRAGEIRLTRFLRNPAVTVEEMAAEAAARTAGRCAGRPVLAIQDTTVVTSEGGGGLYLHAVLAVDEDDGAILGLMHACFLARDAGRRSARGSRPLAEKESRRWLDGAGRAAEVGATTELLVRAAQDRSLGDGGRLFGRADALAEGGRARLRLPAKPGRPAREALVAVRFMAVELARPTDGVRTGLPKSVVLNLVDVREVDPPAGEGVHWRLLTTLPGRRCGRGLRGRRPVPPPLGDRAAVPDPQDQGLRHRGGAHRRGRPPEQAHHGGARRRRHHPAARPRPRRRRRSKPPQARHRRLRL